MLHEAGADNGQVLPHDKKPDRLIITEADDVLRIVVHFNLVLVQHLSAKACWLESKDKLDVPLTVGWSALRRLMREGFIEEFKQDYPHKYYRVTRHGERTHARLTEKKPEPVMEAAATPKEPEKPPEPQLKPREDIIPGMHATIYRIDGRNAMTLIFDNAVAFVAAKTILGIKDKDDSIEIPTFKANILKPIATPKPQTSGRECFYCERILPEKPGRKPWRVACDKKSCQALFMSDSETRAEMKAEGLTD